MFKVVVSALIVFCISLSNSFCCTTAVISGKYTEDGRPLLWKHRDTDFHNNKLMYFTDGKFDYIGLINTKDIKGEQVWAGTNSSGFSIMNAALYDVNLDYKGDYKNREGFVMKMALQECATIEDFEKFLKKLTKPYGVSASFGVIDAKGGAAFYETDNNTFVKYDANDPRIAPNGYIIRSNFAYIGKKDKGYGYIRYETAQNLFSNAFATNNLNYKTIISEFSRSFSNSLLNTNFRKDVENNINTNDFINSDDLICRNSSASAIVIHGVKKDESPKFTTMWTVLGFPFTTVAVPCWIEGGKELPSMMMADEKSNVPLCDLSLQLKDKCYPIKRASGYKYLKISELINTKNTGITQKIEQIEQTIFAKTEKELTNWRKNSIKKDQIQNYYKWINTFVMKEYQKNFF